MSPFLQPPKRVRITADESSSFFMYNCFERVYQNGQAFRLFVFFCFEYEVSVESWTPERQLQYGFRPLRNN